MVTTFRIDTDCFFLLRRHRNDDKLNTVIPHLLQDLNRCAMIVLISCAPFLFSIPAFSQTPDKTIKIGFLIRDKDDLALQRIAELAIQEANAKGGYKGQKFELVTKSCDGPWGITSKQTVALIYEDQVPIVVTALDGRNAHLAEQVTAKSHVVMLSTLASDPTLSRAYVPWYFRMVPDDRQQAQRLAEDIYIKNNATKVAMIALDNYDGKQSGEAFEKETKKKGFPAPELFINLSEDELHRKLSNSSWDAVVLAGTPKDVNKLEGLLQKHNVYTFTNYFNFQDSQEQNKYFKTIFPPTMDYVSDGISLAIKAINTFGIDSESIRTGFKELNLEGKTGFIEFDKFGNRLLE